MNRDGGTFDIERAICHEAGHVVVARYFGISVDSVRMVGGYPVTYVYISELNQLPASQQYAYLAGGVAAEQFVYGDYDTLGMGGDQAEITRRHGGAIGLYLPDALTIIRSNSRWFQNLRTRIKLQWAVASTEAGGMPTLTEQIEFLSKAAQSAS